MHASFVWCVQGRDGWCACKINQMPVRDSLEVKTLCGCSIILPFAAKFGTPDCSECLEVWNRTGVTRDPL